MLKICLGFEKLTKKGILMSHDIKIAKEINMKKQKRNLTQWEDKQKIGQ